MRVLIVEDSVVLRTSLDQGLREAGFAVDAVADGARGLIHARTTDYDVIILDWALPEMDGLTVLNRIREKGSPTAVLMLTARDTIDDRVRGLSAGADDYLVKPFAFAELLARVHALARRRHAQPSPMLRVGGLSLDTVARTARRFVADATTPHIPFTPREYAILEYLAHRAGKPVSRMELEEHIYDDRSRILSNAVDSAIAAIRRKLEREGLGGMIQTRRKIGYVLRESA